MYLSDSEGAHGDSHSSDWLGMNWTVLQNSLNPYKSTHNTRRLLQLLWHPPSTTLSTLEETSLPIENRGPSQGWICEAEIRWQVHVNLLSFEFELDLLTSFPSPSLLAIQSSPLTLSPTQIHCSDVDILSLLLYSQCILSMYNCITNTSMLSVSLVAYILVHFLYKKLFGLQNSYKLRQPDIAEYLLPGLLNPDRLSTLLRSHILAIQKVLAFVN